MLMQVHAGGLGGGSALNIDDLFDIVLRTGTSAAASIASSVDMTDGLFMARRRNATSNWAWYDTVRGVQLEVSSSNVNGEATQAQGVTAFGPSGVSIGTLAELNTSGGLYANYFFKRSPGFLDIVTYAGNGTANRAIPHNLGVTPGQIFIKNRSFLGQPMTAWHKSAPTLAFPLISSAGVAGANYFGNGSSVVAPTSTDFTLGAGNTNQSGTTYVAYIFADNPSLIAYGSYTGNGSTTGPIINCGFVPQHIQIKSVSTVHGWFEMDTARGITSGADAYFYLESTQAEGTNPFLDLTSSGFQLNTATAGLNTAGVLYIYRAIRAP